MNKIKTSVLVLSGALFSSNAMAGGFQLSEYSTTNLSRAFAGTGIVGDDYSAIAFNPAGMVFKGDGLQIGANVMRMSATAEGNLNNLTREKGKLETIALVPHFFGQKKISDNFRVGVGFFAPYGFKLKYNDDWYAKSHALLSDVSTLDLVLAGAYKVNDKVSIGGGVIFERLEAQLTNTTAFGMVSSVEGNSYAMGFSAGVTYRPFENTRFGISYRSRTAHDIKGTHKMGPYKGFDNAELTLPAFAIASAYQKIGDFGLSASVKWTEWKTFGDLDIYSNIMGANALVSHTEEDWKNTWTLSLGTDYYVDDKWTVRAGVAYDQTGIRDSKHRTARIPDSDRIITSIGLGYKYENWQFDLGYAHMFMKRAESHHTIPGSGTLNAVYKPYIDLFAVSVQYNF